MRELVVAGIVTSLVTQSDAERLYLLMAKLLQSETTDRLILNFTKAKELTSKFFDTCFRPVLHQYGPEEFCKRLELRNMSDNVADNFNQFFLDALSEYIAA